MKNHTNQGIQSLKHYMVFWVVNIEKLVEIYCKISNTDVPANT